MAFESGGGGYRDTKRNSLREIVDVALGFFDCISITITVAIKVWLTAV